MKKIYKYLSLLLLAVLILSGCDLLKKKEEPVDPHYESGLTQQELFSYLNKELGYREDKADSYIYFSFYLDYQVVYSFSNEDIKYNGTVIDFEYSGENHFAVSCQFDPEENQNFASFVKTFDIFFDSLHPERMEITFDDNTYHLINDTGYDYGGLLLELKAYQNFYIDFSDVSLYICFHLDNQFSYDNSAKIITGTIDNITYLGQDVYDLNVRFAEGDKQYHNSFLIVYSNAHPDRIFIELPDYGVVEMKADRGYDIVEILTILTNDGPFREINGNNIRMFDANNCYYSKTNVNGDYLLNGLITLFDYQGKGYYKMTVMFSGTGDFENQTANYNIEVTFNYNEEEKILKVKEYDISRMIEENYLFKAKK